MPDGFELLEHVQLQMKVELGRCRLPLADVLKLGSGALLKLDRKAADPIDVLVNEKLIARGVIVAIDDRYGIRITKVLGKT